MTTDNYPNAEELVRMLEDYYSSHPPNTLGSKGHEKFIRARIGKPKQGKIIDRLSDDDGRTAKVIYNLNGDVQHTEGDNDLLEHFKPGEGMDEYLQSKKEHFEEVRSD